jgi:hypothetical protein
MEVLEDPMATPAVLEMAISRMLDSLPEEHDKSVCQEMWLCRCNMQRNWLGKLSYACEDITDCFGSQGNQARGTNLWVNGL